MRLQREGSPLPNRGVNNICCSLFSSTQLIFWIWDYDARMMFETISLWCFGINVKSNIAPKLRVCYDGLSSISAINEGVIYMNGTVTFQVVCWKRTIPRSLSTQIGKTCKRVCKLMTDYYAKACLQSVCWLYYLFWIGFCFVLFVRHDFPMHWGGILCQMRWKRIPTFWTWMPNYVDHV